MGFILHGWVRTDFKCHIIRHINCVHFFISHSLLNPFHSSLITAPKQLLRKPPRPEMTMCPNLILHISQQQLTLWPLLPRTLSSFGFTDIPLLVFLPALHCFSSLSLNNSFLSAWPLNVQVTQNLVLKLTFFLTLYSFPRSSFHIHGHQSTELQETLFTPQSM